MIIIIGSGHEIVAARLAAARLAAESHSVGIEVVCERNNQLPEVIPFYNYRIAELIDYEYIFDDTTKPVVCNVQVKDIMLVVIQSQGGPARIRAPTNVQ